MRKKRQSSGKKKKTSFFFFFHFLPRFSEKEDRVRAFCSPQLLVFIMVSSLSALSRPPVSTAARVSGRGGRAAPVFRSERKTRHPTFSFLMSKTEHRTMVLLILSLTNFSPVPFRPLV